MYTLLDPAKQGQGMEPSMYSISICWVDSYAPVNVLGNPNCVRLWWSLPTKSLKWTDAGIPAPMGRHRTWEKRHGYCWGGPRRSSIEDQACLSTSWHQDWGFSRVGRYIILLNGHLGMELEVSKLFKGLHKYWKPEKKSGTFFIIGKENCTIIMNLYN